MFKSGSAERHPFHSLLLLLLLIFSGAFLFTIIALALGSAIFGLDAMIKMSSGSTENIQILKLVQIVTSIGMFILPALWFAKMESNNWLAFLKLNRFSWILVGLTILIMFGLAQFLEYINDLNKSMALPSFLKDLEAWMLLKEQQMELITKQLLVMPSVNSFLVNILMLAIIPAIGEELTFRGCLQKIFKRWTGNYHAAIWITAIIFSSIHFQFYGFIPRMLLGALFGYLFVWSGSLWIPIVGHFLNNAAAVVIAYVYQQNGKSVDEMFKSEKPEIPFMLIGLAVSVLLLRYFYVSAKKEIPKLINNGSRMD
ncbi:MAG: CPBP family intramembrane glutamic endopeptidase [Pedobacter sp.]|jgi:hypothetical protein